jgi:diguanylate cyclase (GGDEF)-like protein
VAVFFVDLDGFRHINDALGHTAGDAMLKATAAALLDAHPNVDNWGRLGGDEFLLYIPGIDEEQTAKIGASLSEAARRTVSLGGRMFVSTVSIGFTVAAVDERIDAYELMQQADIAMHSGKRRLPGLVTRFDPELRREVLRRAELESQLRATLLGTGPGFAVQPIMNVRDRTVFALEALIRFRSPTLGPVRADWCVEIAERAGLIHQLDRHVLRKASQAVVPLTDPANGSPLSLSVNCSSTTNVHGADLATRMLETIDEAGLPPSRLIVEITESAAVAADATLLDELSRLRDAGVRIAIDDFGTGHSSLSQLEEFDVDIVKIDRMFMRDVPESTRRLRYLESITALVNTLGPQLVVEGIERVEQIAPLLDQDVPLMQGYLFSEPVPANDIRANIVQAGEVLEAWSSDSGVPYQPVLDWTGEITRDGVSDLID